MKFPRLLSSVLLVAVLAGCATPPGHPTPLPTDFAEQTRNQEIFKRYSDTFNREPDVLGVYLTSNNNPRSMVVIVQDLNARRRLLTKYGGTIEGLDVRYLVNYEPNPGDEIVAVPKVEPPKTWWERLIVAFVAWKNRVLVPAAPAPSPVGELKQI